jgi:ADP-heptose:LPS heptosyltransferase
MSGTIGGLPREAVRRLAVLRALQLGDLLVAVPALRALRAGFPAAEITLVGLTWARAFAARFGHYVDRCVEFGGWAGIAEAPYVPARAAAFTAAQRAYGYDLAIQLHGSGATSNACVLAWGARATAGYYPPGAPRPGELAVAVPYPERLPEVLRCLRLVERLGCPAQGTHLEWPLAPAERAEAAALLAPLAGRPRPWVGLHPGARAPARRWPAARFAAVGDALVRRLGASLVVTGGPDEVALVEEVAAGLRGPALRLAGGLSLGTLAAVIASLDLFVSNDTGPAHLAQAVGTPSVIVFGPADPRRWAPLDPRHRVVHQAVDCSPCGHWECPIDHRCLHRITPARVVAAAETVLAEEVPACGA